MVAKKYPYDLLFNEGNYTVYDNIANELSKVYQYIVESRKVLVPDPTRPFFFELWCKETHAAPNATTAITSPLTLTYRNLIPQKANGDDEDPGVTEVAYGTVGGTLTKLTITAHTATTISFSDTLDAGTSVDVYHIPDEPAQVVWSLARPDMVGDYGRPFIDVDPRVFTRYNPYNSEQFVPFTAPFVFPEDWIIWLRLKAAWPVAWKDSAGNYLPIRWSIPWLVEHRRDFPTGLEKKVAEELIQVG